MNRMLAFCLLLVLLVSCGKTEHNQLTLIFENAPVNSRAIYESDTVSFKEKENTVKRLFWFKADNGWLEEYIPQGSNDTLRISSAKLSHIEFRHAYRLHTYHYVLLQVGDTVRVRYLEDGTPVYRSSISDELTTLYNGDELLFGKFPQDFQDELYYKIRRGLFIEGIAKASNVKAASVYEPVDSLLEIHQKNIQRAQLTVDSLAKLAAIPVDYESYYSYRIKQLNLEPEIIKVASFSEVDSSLVNMIASQLFDDAYRHNISYWRIVANLINPLIMSDGNWSPPIHHYTMNEPGFRREQGLYDKSAIFDRLALYADKVPPATLNMMRYESLLMMSEPEYQYPLEIQQKYLEKYRHYTTDFLTPSYVPITETLSFPFRFFIFLLEFIVCSGAFFAIYLSWLKDKIGFLASRVYLIVALALSLLIPSLALPVHLAMLPDSTLFWSNTLGSVLQLLFYAYLLVCLYMLGYFAWQTLYLRKLRKNSWQIPEQDYTLCILTDIDVRPFAFGRSIFFSWNDWWNTSSKENRSKILEHEVAHVKQWHSLDNILLMVGRVLYWANPLLLTYGKEIRRVNEFAADRFAIKKYGRASFMKALLETDPNLLEVNAMLVNSNTSEYIERFEKMKIESIPWYKNLRLLIAIPLIIILVLLFSSELLVNIGQLSAMVEIPTM